MSSKIETWLLLTKGFTYLMVGGSDAYYKRIPVNGVTHPLPRTWWAANDHEPPATIRVDLNRQEPAMWQPRQVLTTIPLTPPTANPPHLLITRPTERDRHGLFKFTLQGLNDSKSASWTVFSGAPGAQVILDPTQDRAGSNRPIPHGLYELGRVETHPTGSWGPGLGPIWVTLQEIHPRHRRSAIGLHQDSNYATSPGSAGCVVHPDLSVIRSICDWIEANKPRYLLVDYGFGIRDELKIAKLR